MNNNDDEPNVVEIEWFLPGAPSSSIRLQKQRESRIKRCMESARSCARDFDASFTMRSAERECATPQFYPNELVLLREENDGQQLVTRITGFFKEFVLRSIKENKVDSSKSGKMKQRFISKRNDNFEHYSVKYLQDGVLECDHGLNATTEMILEVKILMSLAHHPNIARLYGISSSGMNSLPLSGTDGYFFITDRIVETLDERMIQWRAKNSYLNASIDTPPNITQRLELALDIASALVFLHDRNLVFYIRPDKIGFDARYGVVKLFNFGQTRQQGMESHPRSIAQSDCIRTLAYSAPEIFCMTPAHAASDVYGFGVMLWEMMSLQQPLQEYSRARHFEEIVLRNRRPMDINEDWDETIAAVIRRCWEPYKRPTIKKVHVDLETRLLYQESANEIVDTARIIQSRHSEGLLESLLNESKELSTVITRRHSDGQFLSPKKGSDVMLPSFELLQKVAKYTETKENYDASNFDAPNGSTSSLLSGNGLDEMLQEVSRALSTGSSQTSDDTKKIQLRQSNAVPRGSKGRRNSRTRTSRTRRPSKSYTKVIASSSQQHDDTFRQSTALDVKLGGSTRSFNDMDVASVDDDEDLIASIMSQSDVSGKKGPSVSNSNSDQSDRMNQLRSEIRKSISAQRGKSPMRPRKRSKSRGRESSLKKESSSEGTAPSTPPTPPPRKSIVKISPKTASKKVPRMSLQGSLSNMEMIPPLKARRFSLNSFGRSYSDSSMMVELRRNRRASVAEVKQKFDFVPDTPAPRANSSSLRILQKSLETASPIRSNMIEETSSPTKKIANVGKRLLRGVLRRHSLKDADEEMAPSTPRQAPRPTIRRGSSNQVLDILKTPGQAPRPTMRRGSSNQVLDILKTPGQDPRPTMRRGSSNQVLDILTPAEVARPNVRRGSSNPVLHITKTPGQAPRPNVRRGSSSLALDVVKQQSSMQAVGNPARLEKGALNAGFTPYRLD
jgi:Protein tyrosine and serine/threonine kinase